MPEFKTHNLWPIPVYESEIPTKKEWQDIIVNTRNGSLVIGSSRGQSYEG
jgi:hypothetical protein